MASRLRLGRLKGSFHFVRLFNWHHVEATSGCKSTREYHKHVQNGSTAREAVVHVIGSLRQRLSISLSLKGSFHFIRLFNWHHVEATSGCKSTREYHKHVQDGSTAREAVLHVMGSVRQGFSVNSYEYVSIIKKCSKEKDIESLKQVHDCIKSSQLEGNPFVASSLMKSYIICGRLQSAQEVFNNLSNKDTVTWNIMIGGYAENGQVENAFEAYQQMRKDFVQPNARTFVMVLKACDNPSALGWGKEIHAQVKQRCLEADMHVGTALALMYSKCGRIEDARSIFDKMEKRDAMSYSVMISGLSQHGHTDEAFILFYQMLREGVTRNVIIWNVMIGGLSQNGLGKEAFALFLQMQTEGFTPDSITYLTLLNSCSSKGALEWVRKVHAHSTKAGFDTDPRVGSALVHMYAKSGSIDDAVQVFDKMQNRDVVSWTVMIGGLAQHGHGRVCLELFSNMIKKGIKPTGQLFVSLLSACSHAGLVEEARFQFVAMKKEYGIEAELEHFGCMVDILGRAGHLEEAKLFILNMPIKPDKVTWKALLGACRTYSNVILGEYAAEKCLELDPLDSSAYVLLSNINAAIGSWDQVASIRCKMVERGMHKKPGRCWIEVDNKVHHFVAADTSHPESREIYAMLNNLLRELKSEGYNPDTRLILRSIDEENKESALCSHSEKLAIAYGLMHVSDEKPIRIYKNLRICTDCHTATKLISKITGREIVARDANRFHHFKQGVCSCNDYW